MAEADAGQTSVRRILDVIIRVATYAKAEQQALDGLASVILGIESGKIGSSGLAGPLAAVVNNLPQGDLTDPCLQLPNPNQLVCCRITTSGGTTQQTMPKYKCCQIGGDYSQVGPCP